jgi:hypothetical protein
MTRMIAPLNELIRALDTGANTVDTLRETNI